MDPAFPCSDNMKIMGLLYNSYFFFFSLWRQPINLYYETHRHDSVTSVLPKL